jgi:hypothetical protein
MCVLCTRKLVHECFIDLSSRPVPERNVLVNSSANICGAPLGYDDKYCIPYPQVRGVQNKKETYEKPWNGILGNVCVNHFECYSFVKKNDVWHVDQEPLKFQSGKKTAPSDKSEISEIVLKSQEVGMGRSYVRKILGGTMTLEESRKLWPLNVNDTFSVNIINKLKLFSRVSNAKADKRLTHLIESYCMNEIQKVVSIRSAGKLRWLTSFHSSFKVTFRNQILSVLTNSQIKSKPISAKAGVNDSIIHHVLLKLLETSPNFKIVHKNFNKIVDVFSIHSKNTFVEFARSFIVTIFTFSVRRVVDWVFVLNVCCILNDENCVIEMMEWLGKKEENVAVFLGRFMYSVLFNGLEFVPSRLSAAQANILATQKECCHVMNEISKACTTREQILKCMSVKLPDVTHERNHSSGKKRKIEGVTDISGECKRLKVLFSKFLKEHIVTGDDVSQNAFRVEGHHTQWGFQGLVRVMDANRNKLTSNDVASMSFYVSRTLYFNDCMKVRLPSSLASQQTRAIQGRFQHVPEEIRQECIEQASTIKICPNCFHLKSFTCNSLKDNNLIQHGCHMVKVNGFDFNESRCVQRETCEGHELVSYRLLFPDETSYLWTSSQSSYMVSPCCGRIMQSCYVRAVSSDPSGMKCYSCIQREYAVSMSPVDMSCAYCMREFKRKNSSVYASCMLKNHAGTSVVYLFCTKKHFSKELWNHPEWTLEKAISFIRARNEAYKKRICSK